MDTTTRSLLLQSTIPNNKEVIPVRRNGCVCFIPVARTQEERNILSDCVRNCMIISRELGGEPTLEECQACCTDCIQSFDNPENCREACVLGKGGPGDPLTLPAVINLLKPDFKFYGNTIFNVGPNFTFRTRLPPNYGQLILNRSLSNTLSIIINGYARLLRDGYSVAFVNNHRLASLDLDPFIPPRLFVAGGGGLRFDSSRVAETGENYVSQTNIFLALVPRVNNMVSVYYVPCNERVDILSYLTTEANPTIGQFATVLYRDGERRIEERSETFGFRPDISLMNVRLSGIFCGDNLYQRLAESVVPGAI